jgi:hypothetical protein
LHHRKIYIRTWVMNKCSTAYSNVILLQDVCQYVCHCCFCKIRANTICCSRLVVSLNGDAPNIFKLYNQAYHCWDIISFVIDWMVSYWWWSCVLYMWLRTFNISIFSGEIGRIYPPDIPVHMPGSLGINFMGFLMFQSH